MTDDLSILEHLEDLRRKLLLTFFAYILLFAAGAVFLPSILTFLAKPLPEAWKELHVFKPQESLLIYLKTAALLALFPLYPLLLFQLYRFIYPGLKTEEKKESLIWLMLSILLFPCGLLFSYCVLLPQSLDFLIRFSERMAGLTSFSILNVQGLQSYMNFFFTLSGGISITFQLPVILIILDRVHILPARTLGKKRPLVLIGVLIISALITPPDIFSQLLVAVPLYALFELSMAVSFFSQRIRNKAEKEEKSLS